MHPQRRTQSGAANLHRHMDSFHMVARTVYAESTGGLVSLQEMSGCAHSEHL